MNLKLQNEKQVFFIKKALGFVQTPRQPPTIFSPNQKVSRVGLGDPFVLECIARGNPQPSVRIVTPERQDLGEFRDANRPQELQVS